MSSLQASMEFFETSPLGRILNRFSSDTNTVDDALPFDLNILLAQVAAVLGEYMQFKYSHSTLSVLHVEMLFCSCINFKYNCWSTI